MKLQEIAEIFGVTEKTVREWISAGMPVERLGKQGRGNCTQLDLASAVRWYFQRHGARQHVGNVQLCETVREAIAQEVRRQITAAACG